MEKESAERLARQLISEYLPVGWRFKWDRAVMRHGMCDHTAKTISLSLPVTLATYEAQVRDTILHEIAHALADPGAGHGPAWRAIARSIGATPRASAPGPDLRSTDAPWVGVCPAGHESSTRYFRRPRTRRSCATCDSRFNPAHIITYRRVDTVSEVR